MLVTLEGIDGSGKTTAWRELRRTFGGTFTREPTESWYGDAVRRSVGDDDADPLAELFLYTADHADHLTRVIQPALATGDLVVSDRYSDSRYAYQAATLANHLPDPLSFVQRVHEPWTRPPDVTLFFDVDPETGAERSGATNKFEQLEFLESVKENYEQLIEAEPDRFVRIDAERPESAVAESAIAAIRDRVDGVDSGT